MMEPVARPPSTELVARRSRSKPPRDPLRLQRHRHLDHRRRRRPIPATGRATCASRCASPTALRELLAEPRPHPAGGGTRAGPSPPSSRQHPDCAAGRRAVARLPARLLGPAGRRPELCLRDRWAGSGWPAATVDWQALLRRTSGGGGCRCPPIPSSASATGSIPSPRRSRPPRAGEGWKRSRRSATGSICRSGRRWSCRRPETGRPERKAAGWC